MSKEFKEIEELVKLHNHICDYVRTHNQKSLKLASEMIVKMIGERTAKLEEMCENRFKTS